MSPKRVLYLTKVYPYPPATAGDAVYSRGLIEALSTHVPVHVICADSGGAHTHRPDINWEITEAPRSGRAGSVLSRWPLIAWKGATPSYCAAVTRALSQDWDVIVLDNLGLAHALPEAMRYREAHPGTKLVYISHEYEYPTRASKYDSYNMSLPKKMMATRDLRKVEEAERALLRECDVVTVINPADLEPFRKIAPGRKYVVLLPGYDGPVVDDREITVETPRRVLVLGGRRSEQKQQILLDWMAAAYETFEAAGIEMVVAGDMEESLREDLRARYPNAQILGFVEDLDALFASARVGVIADTTGGGFKLRLLTQVFQRLPIVGLAGAIDGLPTPEGTGYLGAADLEQLVTLMCDVIDDTDRLNALHRAAFDACAVHFSWAARGEALLAALSPEAEGVV